MSIRAIPRSHRYLAVTAPHHGQHFGSLITIDPTLEDDRAMSQLRRVTPEAMFPEAESAPGVSKAVGGGSRGQVFGTPWPLSEDFYLTVYDPGGKNHALYLLDAFGSRELLYQDPAIGLSDPIPLRARPVPPVIPDQTNYAATCLHPGERMSCVAKDKWDVAIVIVDAGGHLVSLRRMDGIIAAAGLESFR